MSPAALEHPSEQLPWYVNGTLEGEELRRVEEHVASCLACRREIEKLRRLRQELKEAAPTSPGEAGLARLLEAVEKQDVEPRPRRSQSWPWMTAAAAAVLATSVGVGLWHPWSPGVPVEERAGEEAEVLRPRVGPEEVLPRDAFVLRWQVAPEWEGARFSITVTAEDLTPVAEARGLEETEYRVPAEALAGVPPGARLFWRLEALRPDGKRLEKTFRARLE